MLVPRLAVGATVRVAAALTEREAHPDTLNEVEAEELGKLDEEVLPEGLSDPEEQPDAVEDAETEWLALLVTELHWLEDALTEPETVLAVLALALAHAVGLELCEAVAHAVLQLDAVADALKPRLPVSDAVELGVALLQPLPLPEALEEGDGEAVRHREALGETDLPALFVAEAVWLPLREGDTVTEGESKGEELLAGLAVLSPLQLSAPLVDGKPDTLPVREELLAEEAERLPVVDCDPNAEGLSLAEALSLLLPLPLGEAASRRRGALPRNRPPDRTRALKPSSAWGRGASGGALGGARETLAVTWVSGCSVLGSHPSSATRKKRKYQRCMSGGG